MALRRTLLALLTASAAIAIPRPKYGGGFNWGSEKIRGVNLGGWLVLEPWITPSLFPDELGAVDEYTFCDLLGPEEAYLRLKEHWDTWVKFEDLEKIRNAGFNIVRIPIGYWAFNNFDAPYVAGAKEYLDRALGWASFLGLKVMIDLHGAPGSQNGFDNSGLRTANPQWLQGDSFWQTLLVIQQLADNYAKPELKKTVIGIQLLNEPANWVLDRNRLETFYRFGYNIVRGISDVPVILSDAFLAPSSWNNFLTPSDHNAQSVALDHHEYQIFNFEQIAWKPRQHREGVCNNTNSYSGADKWTFVGEWTGAMTDCAKWLNGFYLPNRARYDGTYPNGTYIGDCSGVNDIDSWSDKFKNDTRAYIEAQLDAFEDKTQGWVFWNFKTEGAPEWDLFKLLEHGVFPQPLDARKFPPACSSL